MFNVCAEAVFTISVDTTENLEWPGYGFLMDVSDASLPGDAVKLSVRAILDGQFNLPPDYHLVSAMYWLTASTTIDGALVYIQHCAKITSEDKSPQLQFAVMTPFHSGSLPEKFTICKDIFMPYQQYASFKLPEFQSCLVAAVLHSPASSSSSTQLQCMYTGCAFLKKCSESDLKVDFAITKQLDCYTEVRSVDACS